MLYLRKTKDPERFDIWSDHTDEPDFDHYCVARAYTEVEVRRHLRKRSVDHAEHMTGPDRHERAAAKAARAASAMLREAGPCDRP